MSESGQQMSLLLVDDDVNLLEALRRTLRQEGWEVHIAQGGEEALEKLGQTTIDAAMLDYMMPGMNGLALLGKIRKKYPQVLVIMFTGQGDVSMAVEAMRLGAVDFLEKPSNKQAMLARLGQLRRIWELRHENQALKARLGMGSGVDRFIGESRPARRLKDLVAQLGASDVNVLIQGETGSGKELVAQGIHLASRRLEKPFIPVDCAAISEAIMESELFGHMKGSFTGAHASTLGLIRSADGGTLFLDEIGELPQPIQAKLLRTLQNRQVRPVGSTQSHQVDVRVLAATNRDLAQEVESGNFREDLFFRLNVVTVHVPPLRERPEDIPLLVRYFIERFSDEFDFKEGVSPEALKCLDNHSWPGNVRELQNVIRRAMALGSEKQIMPEDLPEAIRSGVLAPAGQGAAIQDDTLAAYEMAAVQNALQKSQGNRKLAAQLLQIGEATLYRKIKHYQLS